MNTYIATKVCPKRYVGNLDVKKIVFAEKKEDDAKTDVADAGSSSSSRDKRAVLPAKKAPPERKGAKKFYTATYPDQQDTVFTVTSSCSTAWFCNLHHGNWSKDSDIKGGKPEYNKKNPLEVTLAAKSTSEDYNTGFVSSPSCCNFQKMSTGPQPHGLGVWRLPVPGRYRVRRLPAANRCHRRCQDPHGDHRRSEDRAAEGESGLFHDGC